MESIAQHVGTSVWQATWQASLLALLMAGIVVGLRHRLSPAWRHALWSLVLLRMVLPVTPAAPWSLYRVTDWLPDITRSTLTQGPAPSPVQLSPRPDPTPAIPTSADVDARSSDVLADSSAPVANHGWQPIAAKEDFDTSEKLKPSSLDHPTTPTQHHARTAWAQSVTWLFRAWLVGAVFVMARASWLHVRMRRRLSYCTSSEDESLRKAMTDACQRAGIRAPIDVYITPELISPLVMGLLRPKIVLPECLVADRAASSLETILVHELIHLRRRDLWWQAMMTIAMAIHWFNPILRWSLRQMRHEREVACDERTLDCLPHVSAVDYARLIVQFAEQLHAVPLQLTMIGISSSSSSLHRRIQLLVNPRSAGRWHGAIAFSLALLLALGGLTRSVSRVVAAPPAESTNLAAPPAPEATPLRVNDGNLRKKQTTFTGDFELSGLIFDIERKGERSQLKPKEGTEVKLLALTEADEPPQFLTTTTSDANGAFTFAQLAYPTSEMRVNRLSYLMQVEQDGAIVGVGHSMFRPAIMIITNHPRRTLRGRVVDVQGNAVAGARVYKNLLGDRPVTGLWDTTTNQDGHFELLDVLMQEHPETHSLKASLGVEHPDFLSAFQVVTWSEKELLLTLSPGSSFLGQVVYDSSGKPASGVKITALPDLPSDAGSGGDDDQDRYREYVTTTDAEGRFVLRVNRGRYHVLAETADFVVAAAAAREIEREQEVSLPTFRMIEGGFIEGQIVHPRTREPIVVAPERARPGRPPQTPLRLTLGHYGPAYPRQGNMLSSMPVAMVDERGTFRMRVVPGDNYPYVVNTRANRMMWNTLDQSPVKVEPGRTTKIELTLDLPVEAVEVMSVIEPLLAGLPTEREARIKAIANALNHPDPGLKDELNVARRCALIRELTHLGSDAIPSLCRALDREDNPRVIRAWAFALRAIGDRRAVPSLIRAIPRTLGAPGDSGMRVPEPELMAFMQKHDLDESERNLFSYGSPIREVCGSLRVLTGQTLDDEAVAWIGSLYDEHVNTLSQRQLIRHAETWRQWWLATGPQWTTDVNFHPCPLPSLPELTPVDENGPAPAGLQWERTSQGMPLSPPSESGIHLLDVETSYKPQWPADIPRDDRPATLQQLEAWASSRGIDAMCIEHPLAEGMRGYVVRTFGMKAWRLSSDEAYRIRQLARDGRLPTGTPTGEILAPDVVKSPEGVAYRPTMFLFRTREGTWGTLRLTDQITVARDITGQLMVEKGVGFHRGVKFDLGLMLDRRPPAPGEPPKTPAP